MEVTDSEVAVPLANIVGPSTQDALEGVPELWTKYGVDDWVQSGVEIAEPEEEGYHVGGELVTTVDGEEYGHNEKGQPTDHKCTSNNG